MGGGVGDGTRSSCSTGAGLVGVSLTVALERWELDLAPEATRLREEARALMEEPTLESATVGQERYILMTTEFNSLFVTP